MPAASLSIRSLRKDFDGTPAVDNFSLDIEAGEFLVLVGPSGSGKSTVLRMIAGLETPSGGQILVDGKDAQDILPKDRDFAMVFQSYALYPHLTARGNMEFGLKIAGLSRAKIDARIHEAADTLGISQILDRKPHQLSGGERQRVAIGRALVRKPRVFLFDEPFSNLDAQMRAQMRVQLGLLHSRLQATIIYVTHDQVEAMTMGTRVACMDSGTLQQTGHPMDLYSHPANRFVAGFIGTPPMNFVPVQIEGHAMRLENGATALPIPERLLGVLRSADRATLGARPEHIVVCEKDTATISASIETQEFFGSETLLYLSSHDLHLVVRVPPTRRYEVGEPVFLRFQEEHLHAFVEGVCVSNGI